MLQIKLGDTLRKRKMTALRLSQLTGIRGQTISHIISGEIKRLPLDALELICDALNCDISDVIQYYPSQYEVWDTGPIFGPATLTECKLYCQDHRNTPDIYIKNAPIRR